MTFRSWDGNTVWSFIIVVFYLKMCSPLKHGKKGCITQLAMQKKKRVKVRGLETSTSVTSITNPNCSGLALSLPYSAKV